MDMDAPSVAFSAPEAPHVTGDDDTKPADETIVASDEESESEEPQLEPDWFVRPEDAGVSAKVEEFLDKHGAEYEYQGHVPLEAFHEDESLHNQARFKPLDPELIDEYKDAWQTGARFPGIIAHSMHPSGLLVNVDGNHRYIAAKRAGTKTVPVYVVKKADPLSLLVMTYEANAEHGLRTSPEERLRQGVQLVTAGGTVTQVARRLNIKPAALGNAVNKAKAELRASSVGIPAGDWEALPQAVRNKLTNSIENNAVLRETADLVSKTGMNVAEVGDLVRNLDTVRGDPDLQHEVLNATRKSMNDRISATGGGMTVRQRAARSDSPRAVLFRVLKEGVTLDNPAVVAQTISAQERHDTIDRIDKLVKALGGIREALDRKPGGKK